MPRLRTLLLLALLGGLSASAGAHRPSPTPVPSPTAVPAPDVDGLSAPVGQLLDDCFRDYNSLRFSQAESEARQAMQLEPLHPLPSIYLQGVLVSVLQEREAGDTQDAQALPRLVAASIEAEARAHAWEQAHPDARSQLYLGMVLGARGLGDLYRGKLLSAYHNGKRAAAALELSLQRDPGLYDSDLGLGQYLYYCGRLSGILRLLLALHGDIPGGIRRMEACGRQGNRCAPLARMVLARVLVEEEPQAEAALPYVQEAWALCPDNWHYAQLAEEEALALGLQCPEARALADGFKARWDAGWRPPPYAKLDPQRLFTALAQADAEGRR